ncbi:MAG: TIGR04222 domain-containing membrane protein [Mycobacteriales bacterium]
MIAPVVLFVFTVWCLVAALRWRHRTLYPAGTWVEPGRRHDVYELAYLAGGPVRVVDTAVVTLAARGIVTVSADHLVRLEFDLTEHPVEEAIATTLRRTGPIGLSALRSRLIARSPVTGIGDRLSADGLLVEPVAAQRLADTGWTALVLAGAGVFAGMIAPATTGLLALDLTALLAAAAVGLWPRRTTEAGRRRLTALRAAPDTLAVQVAVRGLAAVTDPLLRRALRDADDAWPAA